MAHRVRIPPPPVPTPRPFPGEHTPTNQRCPARSRLLPCIFRRVPSLSPDGLNGPRCQARWLAPPIPSSGAAQGNRLSDSLHQMLANVMASTARVRMQQMRVSGLSLSPHFRFSGLRGIATPELAPPAAKRRGGRAILAKRRFGATSRGCVRVNAHPKVGPESAEISKILAKCGPKPAGLGPTPAEKGPKSPESGPQMWPPAELGQASANFGVGGIRTDVGRSWAVDQGWGGGSVCRLRRPLQILTFGHPLGCALDTSAMLPAGPAPRHRNPGADPGAPKYTDPRGQEARRKHPAKKRDSERGEPLMRACALGARRLFMRMGPVQGFGSVPETFYPRGIGRWELGGSPTTDLD